MTLLSSATIATRRLLHAPTGTRAGVVGRRICLLTGGHGQLRSLGLKRPTTTTRSASSSSSKYQNVKTSKESEIDEKSLKWTERKEAPRWLQRMAPTKGGTELPDAKFLVMFAIVGSGGYYAWFLDPPKKAAEEAAAASS